MTDSSAATAVMPGETRSEAMFGVDLIQDERGIRWGTDAVLLAAYCGRAASAADFGSGCGAVSLFCAKLRKFSRIIACDADEAYASLTRRNAALNGLDGVVRTRCCDVRAFTERVDAVFSNPPYMKADAGRPNAAAALNEARRETRGTIGDFAAAARRCLRCGGSFYVVYRPERMTDLFCAMRNNGIEPKRLTLVCENAHRPPSLILAEGIAGGKPSLCVTPDLILRENDALSADAAYIYEYGDFNERFKRK